MSKLTSIQAQEKHARNLIAASEDMRLGVENVTVAPTHLAAKAKDKMKARLIKSIDDGKWEKGLMRVDLPMWKSAMLNKGLPRVAIGIEESKDKMIKFFDQLLPYQDKLSAEIDKMPDVTLEHSIARMTHQVRGMAKFTRTD